MMTDKDCAELEKQIERLKFRNDVLHEANKKQLDEILDLRTQVKQLETNAIQQFRNTKENYDKRKSTIQIFNWGPCVIKCKIKPEYGKLLLDEAKLNKDDFRTRLAGQIEKETGYSDESKKLLIPILSQYLMYMIRPINSGHRNHTIRNLNILCLHYG